MEVYSTKTNTFIGALTEIYVFNYYMIALLIKKP